MPRTGKRTLYQKGLPGVYRDGDDPKADIVVFRRAGTGKLEASTKEERFPYDTPLRDLKAASNRHAMRASELSKQKGTSPTSEEGRALAEFARYFQKRAKGTSKRGHGPFTKSELKNREYILNDWWAPRIANRRLENLDAEWILSEVGDVQRKDALPVTPAYKDKFVGALSNVYTVLFPNMLNPLRNVGKFQPTVVRGRHRQVNYYLIDALFAHMRDRGHGPDGSRTKAFLMLEAYAGIERGDIIKADPDRHIDWNPEAPAVYLGERAKTSVEGGWVPLHARGLAALRRCEAAGVIGRRLMAPAFKRNKKGQLVPDAGPEWYPSHSGIWKILTRARDAAVKALKADPNLPPEARTDLKTFAAMNPKSLRHSWITESLKHTGSVDSTRRLARHAKDSPQTFLYGEAAMDPKLAHDFVALRQWDATRPTYVKPTAETKAALTFKRRA